MICPICRNGQTHPGFASVTLERNTSTLLFKNVPAQVCENCGEEFIDENISMNLLQAAESAINSGVEMELRRYASA